MITLIDCPSKILSNIAGAVFYLLSGINSEPTLSFLLIY